MKRKTLLPLLTLSLVTGSAVAGTWLSSASARRPQAPDAPPTATTAVTSPAPSSPEQDRPKDRLDVIIFTLRPEGFEPAEVTLPKGRYLLAIENRTGLEEVDLRVDREGGGKLKEARTRRGRQVWKGVVDLHPGRYVVTEAGHPDWVCHVVITN